MVETKQLRKRALECLRLQADCMQLAGVAQGHDVQSHFVHMAGFWGTLAVAGPTPSAGPDIRKAEMQTTDRSPHVVLIVEHDLILKSVSADILEEAGFVVLQAGDADEALTFLESRSDIALLLTSIAMPGSMDGLGLAHLVRERWPAIKLIVASGRVRPPGHDLPTGSRFFLKPYHSQLMISEIRSLIGP